MTTVRRQKVFCGACGDEIALQDRKRSPSAQSAFAWQQENPGCSFWRCRKCADAGRLPPGLERDEWYRALAEAELDPATTR